MAEGLPNCAFQSGQSIEKSIAALRADPSREVEVAASKSFYQYPFHLASEAWEQHYHQTREAASAILGTPSFFGLRSDPDSPKELITPFGTHLLTTWTAEGSPIYLRLGHEDKEIPFVIALGTSGSASDDYTFPGQWEEDPAPPEEPPPRDRILVATLYLEHVEHLGSSFSFHEFYKFVQDRITDFDEMEITAVEYPLRQAAMDFKGKLCEFNLPILFRTDLDTERFVRLLLTGNKVRRLDREYSLDRIIALLEEQKDIIEEITVTSVMPEVAALAALRETVARLGLTANWITADRAPL